MARMIGTALLFCVAASIAEGQRIDDVTPVLVSAAQAVRADMRRGVIIVDPRIVRPGQSVRDAVRDSPNHTAASLSALQRALGGNIAKVEDAVVCEQDSSRGCFRNGVALLALGEPAFNGDTATVVVYKVEPTGATRPHPRVAEAEMRVVLVRDNQSWQVTKKEIVRIS